MYLDVLQICYRNVTVNVELGVMQEKWCSCGVLQIIITITGVLQYVCSCGGYVGGYVPVVWLSMCNHGVLQ